MKNRHKLVGLVLAAAFAAALLPTAVSAAPKNIAAGADSTSSSAPADTSSAVSSADTADSSLMYQNSDFVEKEQPALTEETKNLIDAYQKSATEENYDALRSVVIGNYNAVLAKKEAKLEELKVETAGKPGGEEKLDEMQQIVQEMYTSYWSRINSTMLRFSDSRLLKWHIDDASNYDYIPVMGAGETIYIGRTPVTNAQYADYLRSAKAIPPANWVNGAYPAGEDDFPVNDISYQDAEAYCAWLTANDGANTYRLPSESEWELAAGHMPKDADFNCGVNDGRTPVEQYAAVTRGAHGAVDFWGNVWEWTSTVRAQENGTLLLGVKGGAWNSPRTDCRTEYRLESRDAAQGYEDVGFRVIQVKMGIEPDLKADLTTLAAPSVSAVSNQPGNVLLFWEPVAGAEEYQLFYCDDNGLILMLNCVSEPSAVFTGLSSGQVYRYIVQPISRTAIADNVYPKNSVSVVCQ